MHSRHPARKEARDKGQIHYFTGMPCQNGHISLRYVSDVSCVLCKTRARAKMTASRPSPRDDIAVDWSHLTDEQVARWHMKIDRIRRGTEKTYRHHPLEE